MEKNSNENQSVLDGEGLLNSNVLLLNKFYIALKVISVRRAVLFLAKDYAEVIYKNNGRFEGYRFDKWLQHSSQNNGHLPTDYIHTPNLQILIPRVVRLLEYDKMPRQEFKFNRKNILVRDNYQCQYCGKKYPISSITIDHIIPRSRGGATNWTNVVTSCNKCNTKKGGRLPQEAGMKLIKQPQAPKFAHTFHRLLNDKRYTIWEEFIPSESKH